MPARAHDPRSRWDQYQDAAKKLAIRDGFREVGKDGDALAAHLGISRTTLYRAIRELGLAEEFAAKCEDDDAEVRSTVLG